MSFRSPVLAACALASVPIIAVMNKFYADWLRRNTIDVQNAVAEANKMSLDAFSKVKTDLSITSLNNERKKYFQANDHLYRTNLSQVCTFVLNSSSNTISTVLFTTHIE
jgi:ABC-type bacteriocin/lantibiotic exporter with double-glycine peptidase domain